ncbi:hypothetical protein D3C81_1561390 [compost metagenome]
MTRKHFLQCFFAGLFAMGDDAGIHLPQPILHHSLCVLLSCFMKKASFTEVIFLIQLEGDLFQGSHEIFRFQRQLEHIVMCAASQRFPDQLKIVIVAEHQHFAGKRGFHQQLDQLKTVHLTHFNISNHNIRFGSLHHFQSSCPVRSRADVFKPAVIPADQRFHCMSYDHLVIHNQHLVHMHPTLPSFSAAAG